MNWLKGSYHLIQTQVVWSFMKEDIRNWYKLFRTYRVSKITKNTKSPKIIIPTDNRFDTAHLAIVGPLPLPQGYTSFLTTIDLKTRWLETISQATLQYWQCSTNIFVSNWVWCLDESQQFEADLFTNTIMKLVTKTQYNETDFIDFIDH